MSMKSHMGCRVMTVSGAVTYSFDQKLSQTLKPISKSRPFSVLAPKTLTMSNKQSRKLVRTAVTVGKRAEDPFPMQNNSKEKENEIDKIIIPTKELRFLSKRRKEKNTYLIAAIMSSLGVSSASIIAIYYRFYWQMQGGEFPLIEVFSTFSLALGSAVGMEFWARWAHRALWHASLWDMHQSHHRPRGGLFEVNDLFAIVNAIPAITLLSYGLFNNGIFPGLCFGAGLGITIFGMAYMFVHDGLVHHRFPVGPIANVPYLKKVSAAHQLHHSKKLDGVPYGLFLGPKEVEAMGGMKELEKEIEKMDQLKIMQK